MEITLDRREAEELSSRVAYTVNEIRDDLEGLEFDPQPPLAEDPPSEPEASETATLISIPSRGYITEAEPSPGASQSPDRDTSSGSDMQQQHLDLAEEALRESPVSTEEETSLTAAATKEGSDFAHWKEAMKLRRERKPAPTCFVNTLMQLAGRPVQSPRPFPNGLPQDEVFFIRTEIGVPGYTLPAYETFPHGRKLHRGHPAGTILGPVLSLVSFTRFEEYIKGDGGRRVSNASSLQ